MGRFRLMWGLLAFAATFVAFLVLLILQHRPEASVAEPVSLERMVAAEVAARYAVPAEPPVVTRLSDVAALAKTHPSFYAGLLDGDWLVRYPRLLIVYRREEGRIVKIEAIESSDDR